MTQPSGAKTLGARADNEEKSQPLMVLPSRHLGQGLEGVKALKGVKATEL